MHIANESYFSHVLQIAIWLSKQYCSQVVYTIVAWKEIKKKKKRREKSDSADSSLITSDTNGQIDRSWIKCTVWKFHFWWNCGERLYYFTDRFRLTLNHHMLGHKRMFYQRSLVIIELRLHNLIFLSIYENDSLTNMNKYHLYMFLFSI